MIGTTVTTVKKISLWYWALLFASLVFIILGLALSSFFLFGVSLILFFVSLSVILLAESHIVAEFHEQGINLYPHGVSVDYLALKAVAAVTRSRRKKQPDYYELDIATSDFGFRFPANLDVPSSAIEQFLVGQLSPFIDLPGDEDIAKLYTEQTAKHGANQVYLFHGRIRPSRRVAASRILKFAMFPTVACLLLIGFAFILPLRSRDIMTELLTLEIISLMIVGVATIVALVRRNAVQSLFKLVPQKTALMITPEGFALSQLNLKGKVSWDQIRGIDMKQTANNGLNGQQNMIGVLNMRIEGGAIVIWDAYDRSLSHIEEVMRRYAPSF